MDPRRGDCSAHDVWVDRKAGAVDDDENGRCTGDGYHVRSDGVQVITTARAEAAR